MPSVRERPEKVKKRLVSFSSLFPSTVSPRLIILMVITVLPLPPILPTFLRGKLGNGAQTAILFLGQ